jgi:hypothetical protein
MREKSLDTSRLQGCLQAMKGVLGMDYVNPYLWDTTQSILANLLPSRIISLSSFDFIIEALFYAASF